MRQLADFIASNLSSGAIAGIVVAVVAAVLGAGAAIFFYWRWKAALATHHDLYRIYTPQERPPESATVAPTGISSSLETRGNANSSRNDTPIQALIGRAQQPANNHPAQYDGAFSISPGSRDSRSFVDTMSSPTQSPVDEVRRSRRVNYSKDVEYGSTHRVWDGGLFLTHPEGDCRWPTNFQNLRVRDVVRV